MLKSYGWGGWGGVGGPCDFGVSPRSKSFFFSFYLTFIWLWSLLGPGFGPGLDNNESFFGMEGKFISVMSFSFIQGIVFRKEACKVSGSLDVCCLPCKMWRCLCFVILVREFIPCFDIPHYLRTICVTTTANNSDNNFWSPVEIYLRCCLNFKDKMFPFL